MADNSSPEIPSSDQQSSGATSRAVPPKRPILFGLPRKFDNFLNWTANHWWFEVVVFILAFAVVVIKPIDVQNSVLNLIPGGFRATLFWSCVVAWGLSFGTRKRAEAKTSAANREDAQKLSGVVKSVQTSANSLRTDIAGIGKAAIEFDAKLASSVASIQQIQSVVETLPHETFRKKWADEAFKVLSMFTPSSVRRQDVEVEELESMIRITLATVATLAKSYDANADGAYAANVMLYVPKLEEEPFFEDEIWQVVRFAPRLFEDPRKLVDGVLILRKELSASAANHFVNHIQHDLGFVARTQRISNKWRGILPGAPRAFANATMSRKYAAHGISNVEEIALLNQLDFDIEPDVLEELKKFYSPRGEGKDVKSFLALTLPRSDQPWDPPLGVLNIHSDMPNMLGGSEQKYSIFGQMMAPFVNEIAWAAEQWARKKGLRTAVARK